MSSILDFSRDNPHRVIQWRWERAGVLLNGGHKCSRRRDDSWVRRAYKFRQALAELEASTTPAEERYVLEATSREIYWAYKVWEDKIQTEKKLTAYMIEARVLAGMTSEDISKINGIPPKYIDAYVALFYDVRDKMQYRDYILANVIGPSVYRGLREREYDVLWKLYGYFGGPMVLDLLLTTFLTPTRPTDEKGLHAFVSDAAKGDIRRRTMITAKTMTVNDFNAMQLLTEFNKLQEIEKTGGGGGDSTATILNNIGFVMTSLPYKLATTDELPPSVEGRKDRVDSRAYDEGNYELTGSELLQVAAGQEIKALEDFRDFQMPKPEPVAPMMAD